MAESSAVVLTTNIPGLTPFIRGKVRDVYDLGEHLLIVATDRISAFDVVLPNGIPDKGRVLNQLSAFWFEQARGFCPSHYVSIEMDAIRQAAPGLPAEAEPVLAGRSMLVRKTQALPVECVVRGYLEGSGWKEYRASGSVCGIALPPGLQQGSILPEPIFTPATKAQTGHDENITQEQMARIIDPDQAQRCIALSQQMYGFAAAYARECGIIIADTKFEFGVLDGEIVMIDEALTPDSSRFWDVKTYAPGGPQFSYDKQFVRDYLDGIGWNHEPPAPTLPETVIGNTSAKYRELFERITGRMLSS